MTTNHLLSTSLFTELFQHNIVSADGRIIADPKQLENYYTFLVHRSKEKTTCLYEERKNMVTDVQKLLKIDVRTEEQTELLKRLLVELDLECEEDGLLSINAPKKRRKRYFGPSESKMSLFEREITEELKRVQILKHDLRILDDWLEQISGISCPMPAKADQSSDWKELGIRFRQRTRNRMCDMENARTKLIRHHYVDYNHALKMVLVPNVLLKGTGREDFISRKKESAKVANNDSHGTTEREPPSNSKVKPDPCANSNSVKKESDGGISHDIGTPKDADKEDSISIKKESAKVANNDSHGTTEREPLSNSKVKPDPCANSNSVKKESDGGISHDIGTPKDTDKEDFISIKKESAKVANNDSHGTTEREPLSNSKVKPDPCANSNSVKKESAGGISHDIGTPKDTDKEDSISIKKESAKVVNNNSHGTTERELPSNSKVKPDPYANSNSVKKESDGGILHDIGTTKDTDKEDFISIKIESAKVANNDPHEKLEMEPQSNFKVKPDPDANSNDMDKEG